MRTWRTHRRNQSAANPDLPPRLDVVVAQASAIRPEARFASASEMGAALRGTSPPSGPPRQRPRALIAGVAVAVIAIVAVVAIVASVSGDDGSSPSPSSRCRLAVCFPGPRGRRDRRDPVYHPRPPAPGERPPPCRGGRGKRVDAQCDPAHPSRPERRLCGSGHHDARITSARRPLARHRISDGVGRGLGAGPPRQPRYRRGAPPRCALGRRRHRRAPAYVAVGEGNAWAVGENGLLVRIDPLTASKDGSADVSQSASGIGAGFDSVWVVDDLHGTLIRVDATTLEIFGTYPAPGDMNAIAVGRREPCGSWTRTPAS